MKILGELRAELRKSGLPTAGPKRELEQRLADTAKRKALAEDAAMEGMEDEVVQGVEKPDRMKRVRQFINSKGFVCTC